MANIPEIINTASADLVVSLLEGQVIFFISSPTSLAKWITDSLYSLTPFIFLFTGQEGIEPPTAGFGDQCSTS